MPIQMLRCRKHGVVKHHIGATCELCTSESKEALTKAPNTQSKPCCQAVRLLNKKHCLTWRCPVCNAEV